MQLSSVPCQHRNTAMLRGPVLSEWRAGSKLTSNIASGAWGQRGNASSSSSGSPREQDVEHDTRGPHV